MVAGPPKVQWLVLALLSLGIICPLTIVQLALAGDTAPADTGNQIIAHQSDISWTINPLIGSASPADFYAYSDYQSHNPLVEPETSLIFFYQNSEDAALSLFIIHGPPSREVLQTTASFSFDGLPPSAFILLKNDPSDSYSLTPPVGSIGWKWSTGFTGGVVLGGLTGTFTLIIYPQFGEGISRWALVTGSLAKPAYILLPSLSDPLSLQVRLPDPLANFRYQPTDPSVGVTVTFDASASRSSAGRIIQYHWNFDGAFETRSSIPSTTYAFATAGDHTVTLQVEDLLGRVDSETLTVHVQDDPVTVTRLIKIPLPGSQMLRGYSFTVELLIEPDTTVNGLGIQETPPDGWRIEPLDNAGAQFNVASSEWLFLEALSAGAQRRIRYQIEVPAQEESGLYRFVGRALSGSPQMSSAIGGDSAVQVLSALSIEMAVSRLNDHGEIDLSLSNFISFSQIQEAVALWQQQLSVPGTNGRPIDLQTMVRLVAYWLTDTPVDQPLPPGSG